MNLAQALNAAAPDMPVQIVRRDRPPKVTPGLIVREQVEDGQTVALVLIPETRRYYTFTPEQWKLLSLFDGKRSYQEIAELYSLEAGAVCPETYVRQFAEESRDMPYWYQTPQERNIALSEKLADERRRRIAKQSRFSNLAEITFSAWDPNTFLTKLHKKMSFVFRPWFIRLNLAMFAWSLCMWLAQWKDMGLDTIQFFNFSQKSVAGFAEFWTLMLIVGFIHESAHGLACKHTGGEVHRMGFLLIYLSPAFFCDVTEAWVYGGRWERVTTMVAGLWSEMVLCFFATVVWWGAPAGTLAHRISYEFILLAGIGTVIINLNPLIKLDGYYIFTEMIGISDLKENSANYISAWFRRHICQLPVEVPYVRPRRAALYVPYAILSATYGYTLLFVVVTLTYKAFYRFTPQWAFAPALALALLMFRSRLRTFLSFVKTMYLDKKHRARAWLVGPVAALAGVGVVVLLFAPIWKHTVAAQFVLEPVERSLVRSTVPGFVERVYAFEGEDIQAGASLAHLRNLSLESEAAKAAAEYSTAAARARRAQLMYADYGRMEQDRRRLAERRSVLDDQVTRLTLKTEISGRVVTPRLRDHLGTYFPAGTILAEVDDFRTLRCRIYVPEYDLRDVRVNAPVMLLENSGFRLIHSQIDTLLPGPVPVDDSLLPKREYRGARAPNYYVVTALLPNGSGTVPSGATGTARIFVRRESIAQLFWRKSYDFSLRKLW